ncbi:MAG: hypothetical protein V3U09_05720 [Thermoplasmata archaeon]
MKREEDALLKQLGEDSRWIRENIKMLRRRFEGKTFAVQMKKVIASNDSILLLLEELEREGVNVEDILIESIPPRDVAFIL